VLSVIASSEAPLILQEIVKFWGRGDKGAGDLTIFLFQESTKCLRSGEFGGEAGWYWSGDVGAWSECLYQCQLPLATSKLCLFDTQNLEQSNLLL